MGTRNLTAVMFNGEYRLAQYGQWDGYPEGQGATALGFCRENLTTEDGRARFAKALSRVRFAEDDETKRLYESIGVTGEWITMEQSAKFNENWPYFSRDLGAKILQRTLDATGEVLTRNAIDFAGNSTFCEWAYVIDLDACTFEAFRGFNKKPLDPSERFAKAPKDDEDSEYHPVRLVRKWKLDNLPSEEAFLDAFSIIGQADEIEP